MTDYLKYYYQQKHDTDARIQQQTEKNRKSDVTLLLVDRNEKPVKARVSIRQKTHAFKFGCNIFMLDQFPDEAHNQQYREKFPELFNYAVVPFYWSDYEPENGKPRVGLDAPNIYRRPAPDKVLAYTDANGISTKGHCLMWHSFLPDWLTDDKEQNMLFLQRRIRQIALDYGDRIADFDVVNETLIRTPYHTREQFIPYDVAPRTFSYTDKLLTGNRLFINETPTHSWRSFCFENSPYYLQIENLLLKGLRIDGIGLQYHLFNDPAGLADDAESLLNPTFLFDVLDQYARFQRPIHISEITIPAYVGRVGSPEDQAEMTEFLYRLWFSHASVEAIVWWNLVDGTAAYAPLGSTEGENYYGGGLLNYDMTEKPAYKVLKRLILDEWRTNIDTQTDGQFCFRGFHGEYDIDITTEQGEQFHKTCSISKQDNIWKIVCG